MATLSASVESIIDGIVAAIQAAVDESGSALSEDGVLSVVRGPVARPMPALPSVWVVPQLASFRQGTYDAEEWSMPVSIAALVKSDDPAQGGKLSQRIAANARAAALDMSASAAEVIDATSLSFDTSARSSERNRTLLWTEATIRVTFTVTG